MFIGRYPGKSGAARDRGDPAQSIPLPHSNFVQLVCHILGQEQLASWAETVTEAFDDFIAEHNTFSSLQIQFLQTLKTFILQTGRIERQSLVEAPFTRLHPQGVRGVFPANEIEEILQFAEKLVA